MFNQSGDEFWPRHQVEQRLIYIVDPCVRIRFGYVGVNATDVLQIVHLSAASSANVRERRVEGGLLLDLPMLRIAIAYRRHATSRHTGWGHTNLIFSVSMRTYAYVPTRLLYTHRY